MNKSDLNRNLYMLNGALAKKGYDWWWHSFTGYNSETGEEKSFFIEYFIINPSLGNDKVILGQIEDRKEVIKPSYIMIKAGTWGKDAKQINNFYPINSLQIDKNELNISLEKCQLSEKNMKGKVFLSENDAKEYPEYMSDSGTMEWDLKINKKVSFNVGYGASSFFRKLNAFEMFWHVEGMKTEYEGTVVLDGITYNIIPEKSYGYADKNWGKDFTSPWVWISSCNMKSLITGKTLDNSVFDIGGGKPKAFGIALDRKLLIDFYYEGKEYEYNFSKFWTRGKTEFQCIESDNKIIWNVNTENRNSIMELTCECNKDEMLFINYESPDGYKRHNKLWNGGTGKGVIKLYSKNKGKKELIDKIEYKNAGCEFGEY